MDSRLNFYACLCKKRVGYDWPPPTGCRRLATADWPPDDWTPDDWPPVDWPPHPNILVFMLPIGLRPKYDTFEFMCLIFVLIFSINLLSIFRKIYRQAAQKYSKSIPKSIHRNYNLNDNHSRCFFSSQFIDKTYTIGLWPFVCSKYHTHVIAPNSIV